MQKFRFNFTKTAQALLLAVLMIPFFSTCKDDKPVEPPEPPKSNATEMTNFKISVTGLTPFDAQLQSDGTTFEFLAPLIDNGAMFDQSRLNGATASFTLSPKATSNPASGATGDFTKNVTYTVTAEDGTTTKTYTVKKRDGTSDKAEIESFTLTVGDEPFEGDVNKDDKTVTVSVHSGAWDGLDGAVPTFTLSLGATASPASDVPQNFTEPVEYEITAHAGNKETWTVTVELEEPEANFESFSLKLGEEIFDDGVIDTENHTVTFTIQSTLSLDNPDGWPPKLQIVRSDFLADATPTFTCSRGAVVTPATGEPQDFSETVEYTIKAANGEEVTWTVTVNIIPMPANITVFYLYFLEGAMPPDFPVDEENAIRIQSQETTKPMHGLAKIDAENGIITYELPMFMPAWFTADKMKNIYALVDVDWNVYKSMTPGPNDPQDFSKDVVYVLTAADGTEKTWTVKAPKFYTKEKWTQEYGDFEGIADVSNNNPNSIALIDDYVVIGRTNALLDKATGTLSATKLNVEGWRAWNNQAANAADPFTISQDFPFFITNDDAGNMIGVNLGAWNSDKCVVATWSSATDPAVPIVDMPTKDGDDKQIASLGRKLQVLGDVNGNALLISPNSLMTATGGHVMLKINGGVVNPDYAVVETGKEMNNNSYQLLTPLGLEPVGPYYIGSVTGASNNIAVMWYGQTGGLTEIKGPFENILKGNSANGWGNKCLHYQKLFTFNGKNMMATLSGSEGDNSFYCFGVFERAPEGTLTPVSKVAFPYSTTDNVNGNVTGSFTMEKVGNDILFYVFATNKAVACYQFTAI